jgi:outer membrane biosynthesis protein TonB
MRYRERRSRPFRIDVVTSLVSTAWKSAEMGPRLTRMITLRSAFEERAWPSPKMNEGTVQQQNPDTMKANTKSTRLQLGTRGILVCLAGLCWSCLSTGVGPAPRGPESPPTTLTEMSAGEHSFSPPRVEEPRIPVEYPAELRQRGIEGHVKLWLTIDPDGAVVAVDPVAMPSEPALYEAAKQAAFVQRWIPAKHDGRPVFTVLEYMYVFRLSSQ